MEELEAVRLAPVVVAAVSKSEALVSVSEVSTALIPPLSLSVVWEYADVRPPQVPAPKPVPETTVPNPVLIWYSATTAEPPPAVSPDDAEPAVVTV